MEFTNLRESVLIMKMILERASDSKLHEVVDVTTLAQVLELALIAKLYESRAGVIITEGSILDDRHEHSNIKWHITIYDNYIE